MKTCPWLLAQADGLTEDAKELRVKADQADEAAHKKREAALLMEAAAQAATAAAALQAQANEAAAQAREVWYLCSRRDVRRIFDAHGETMLQYF